MKSVHVCHVLSTFGLGGMERVALDLAIGLHERSGRSIVVALDSEGPIADELRAARIEVRTLPRLLRGYDVTVVLRLAKLLRDEGVHVVHTHNPLAMVYGAVAGRIARCGVVHTKHGINPSTARQRFLRRQTARLVDCYVAVSPATAIVALSKREIDATRLSVIPNGIDLHRFDESDAREAVRRELGIGEDAFVVGTVGRLVPEKDQATLLRAAAPLLGEGARLLVVGDGPEAESLRALSRALPNGRFVHLLGARSDVPRVLAAMDVFALSSVTEGLPLALLEAMAAGLPVLSTPVGGVRDVVRPTVTGHLFDVGDAERLRALLAQARRDRPLAKRMGAAGRAFVHATYSRDTAIERYLAAYAKALSARGAEPRTTPRAARVDQRASVAR